MPHFRKRLLASWHFCCFFMYILYKTYIFLPKHEWSIHFSFVFMFQLFVCIKYTFLLRFHGDYPFWVPSSSSWPFQWVGGHHRKCPVVFRESQLTQTFLCTLNRYVWLRSAPPCRVCSLWVDICRCWLCVQCHWQIRYRKSHSINVMWTLLAITSY